jgi:hypothetical protein
VSIKYVTQILNGKVSTSGIGGKTFFYSNDDQLVDVIIELINQGYAFVNEPAGWPPAAVLENLKDKGLLNMPFTAITWKGPNDFKTYEIS